MNGWWWLLLGGAFEIAFTTALKLMQHNPIYGLAFLVLAPLSFTCLMRALKTMPLSMAYALFTGIGAVGTLVVGATVFHEPLTPLRLVLLLLLIAVLVGLKFATPEGHPKPERTNRAKV